MRVLMNGATGGLGSDLIEVLEEVPHEVLKSVVDVTDGRAVWYEVHDVKPDVVMHLAALTGTKDCEEVPGHAIRVNVEGAFNVARAAVDARARVVYYSTTAIFQPGIVPLKENSPINHRPQTIYGTSKYWGEQVMRRYVPPGDLLVVRPCMAFGGKRDRVSQLSALIRSHWTRRPVQLLLDPVKLKDYCPVRNVSTAVLMMLQKDLFGESFNVSYGQPQRYQEIVDHLCALGLSPRYDFHPEYDFLGDHTADVSKLRSYGWEPLRSREAEIDSLIARCREEMGA